MASAPLPGTITSSSTSAPVQPGTGSPAGVGAFNPRVVLGLVLFGFLAFLATLYFIGSGQTGGDENNGNAHAVANGLTGYSALVKVLEGTDHEVEIARSPSAMTADGLLILSPPRFADAEELTKIISERRFIGPTLVIMPKWFASGIPDFVPGERPDGWVLLGGVSTPEFAKNFEDTLTMTLKTGVVETDGAEWSGLGFSGKLPDAEQVMEFEQANLIALVQDADGDILAGYLNDGGSYPVLAEAAIGETRAGGRADVRPDITAGNPDDGYYSEDGEFVPYLDDGYDDYRADQWGVTFVAEPDLLNNYGMADENRVRAAHALIDTVMEGQDLPITFDVTLNGLGRSQNLLTLAFTPPFLAATLCLILALLVVGWRAFRRFGPPLAEGRAIAFGKRRLVANSAGLIQRSGRLHLLTQPYADMIGAKLAAKLGLRNADAEAIDAAMARRLPDEPSFTELSGRLLSARRANEILRAAHALKSIERKL